MERTGDSKSILEGIIDRNWWRIECGGWGEMIHQGEFLQTCILSQLQLLNSAAGDTNIQSLWQSNPGPSLGSFLKAETETVKEPSCSLYEPLSHHSSTAFLFPSGPVPAHAGRSTAAAREPTLRTSSHTSLGWRPEAPTAFAVSCKP